jgi:diguanylate cyclase (GGDEF)-like protein
MFAIALAATMLTAGSLFGGVRVQSRFRQLRAELVAARWSAEHDPLTGLLNRVGVQRHYEAQVVAGRALVAVLIDLDGFKAVNDTWGHQAGDAQLAAVGGRLAEACAAIDAQASRLAGDEFLLLLPDADPRAVLEQVTAILARLSAPITLLAADTFLATTAPSASAGIALPEGEGTWADLLRCADIALYRAKAMNGQPVLYTCGMQQPSFRDSRGPRLRDSEVANYV